MSAFEEPILRFHDPDQVPIGIVGCAEDAEPGWSGGGVPPCHALRGLHGVTLSVQDAGRAATILSDVLGFREVGRDGPYRKLVAHGGHGGLEFGGGDLAVLVGVDHVEALGRTARGGPLALVDGAVAILVPVLDEVGRGRHLGRRSAGAGQQGDRGGGEDELAHVGFSPKKYRH